MTIVITLFYISLAGLVVMLLSKVYEKKTSGKHRFYPAVFYNSEVWLRPLLLFLWGRVIIWGRSKIKILWVRLETTFYKVRADVRKLLDKKLR